MKLNKKLIAIGLLASISDSTFGMEDEMSLIVTRVAKVHIEHNQRFNTEYDILRELSREKAKIKIEQKNEDDNIDLDYIDIKQLQALGNLNDNMEKSTFSITQHCNYHGLIEEIK